MAEPWPAEPWGARLTIRLRRDIGRAVRPSAEQVDGKTYQFARGWQIEMDESYPGEVAWIVSDAAYPHDAPLWIASGDLESAS